MKRQKSKPTVRHSNAQSAPAALSKTDVRYWRARLFTRSNQDWQVQIAFQGHQEKFPLGTPNKEAAAARAREIYLCLHKDGWPATRAKFKPWTVKFVVERNESPTIGEYLAAIRAASNLDLGTFITYSRKFRRLVAGALEIEGDKRRFNYRTGGAAAWRTKVDAVKLCDLTPARVELWKKAFIEQAGDDKREIASARRTLHSIIRNSKSLFAAKHLKGIQTLKLPIPLPLADVISGEMEKNRYESKINAGLLYQQAERELATDAPELWKIFLLAICVGLRRGEIDYLMLTQFDWARSKIRIEANRYWEPKTITSAASVDVDPKIMEMFRKFIPSCTGGFFINSHLAPRAVSTWHRYRCAQHFKALNDWLGSHGVDAHNPTHTLRKEFGSWIAASHGIYAASAALRHGNINVTRDHYLDKKNSTPLLIKDLLREDAA